MKLMIINGPNLNMLGQREVKEYGTSTLEEIKEKSNEIANLEGFELEFHQGNCEGKIIDFIHRAKEMNFDGIIINPAAYSHYSIAIYDALLLLNCPIIEVHLSDVLNREDFRKNLITAKACNLVISGEKEEGYYKAIKHMNQLIKSHKL